MKKLLILPFIFMALFSFSGPVTGNMSAGKQNCPVCKSDTAVIPIVYGKPGTELIRKAERGECRLGGCVISENSPRFYCKKEAIAF